VWEIVTQMLNGIVHAEETQNSIIRTSTRIGIIGVTQTTTDMPEHRSLYTLFPEVDWNTRARGVGATLEIPLLSIAEENLLCYSNDQWIGQNVLVHEFAHTIKILGLDLIDPTFHAEVQRAYQQALDADLWPETYVSSNIEEYWAEGVRLYFQIDAAGVPGGRPYPANSRAELQRYDPELYRLVETIFGSRSGISPCPG
jgi:alpha-glucosidase